MSTPESGAEAHGSLVVVGSSAGGVEALSVLVSTLPADFPAPIVLAQHLDPTRASNLAAILDRRSTLPLVLVGDSTRLEPGTVYVVPSNRHVRIEDHRVVLEEDHHDRPRPSVDLLLSTAAKAYGERLIAVILTGSGSDGASGALDVKEQGGTVVIQNPETARYPSMPMALPPTGVDHVADLERIGPLLHDLVQGLNLPEPHDGGGDALRDILTLVSRKANIDFQPYKPSTIMRRISRRMAMTHNPTLREYRQYIEAHPEEVGELVMAFLIKVTQFFRDTEAFTCLKRQVLPEMIERGRQNGRGLRFWSAGCATGEEPYSLAILVADLLGAELPEWSIKIFATDLDESAIAFARRGLYPRSALQILPEAYRARFFEPVDQGYRIVKALRQMVIFGQQDLSRRAPFPRIDLVVCRNLLIYFKPELQQTLLDLFAYSLHETNGYLFLGKAETARPSRATFELIDKRWKVYRCTHGPISTPARAREQNANEVPGEPRAATHASQVAERPSFDLDLTPGQYETAQLRRFNELLLRYLPIGVAIIDRSYRIVTVNSAARRLLGIREMANDQDFLHTVRDMPYNEVRGAIDRVFRHRASSTLAEIELDPGAGGSARYLTLTIMPMQVDLSTPELAMISVSDVTEQVQTRRRLEAVQSEQKQLLDDLNAANRRLNDMNKELQDANEELQATNEEMMLAQEELQATNEEFEATNEELQATNEELQATNEELETTNEELETTNEELSARSAELHELTRMLEAERTRLAQIVELAPYYIMVLRGNGLTVEAYNPRYARMFEGRAIRGRPLDEVMDFFWDGESSPIELIREVYQTNTPRVTPRLRAFRPTESGDLGAYYFTYEIVPAYDPGGRVDGVIIYATDVTAQRAREIEEERQRLQLIFEHANQVALALYDAQTARLLTASARYLEETQRNLGAQAADLIGRTFGELDLVTAAAQATDLWQQALEQRAELHLPELRVRGGPGQPESVWDWSLTPIGPSHASGDIQFMLVSAVEITQQVRARERVEELDRIKDEFLALASHELRTPLTPIKGYAELIERAMDRRDPSRVADDLPRLARIASTMRQQIERLERLIADLVDVGRLESGKLTLNRREVDLGELLQRVGGEARMLSSQHTIELRQIDDGAPLVVWGDSDRLVQVILNLLQNAITYAPESQRIDVRLDRADAGAVRIEVQDYGPGIAPEDHEALFTRFYQVARGGHLPGKGLGLGLYIARQIVEQHGGTIAIDSTIGAGSTFIVQLPLITSNQ